MRASARTSRTPARISSPCGPRGPLSRLPEATLDSFSQLLEGLSLFPRGRGCAFLDYRRWAYESAALDLALRQQAGMSLAEAVGREPQPVTFVVSLRIENPPAPDPIPLLLERYPSLRFKLDPTGDWDEALVAALGATGAVDTLDLKGAYKGTPVDQPGDPTLYRMVAEGSRPRGSRTPTRTTGPVQSWTRTATGSRGMP